MTTDRYSSFEELKLSWPEDKVLQIVVDSPTKVNAMDAAMHREFASIWAVIDRDPDARSVVVTGSGGNFSAGGDLGLVEDIASNYDSRARTLEETRELVYGLLNCRKPIVSGIRGVAVGAGLTVGLMADISVVSRDARLIDGHVRLGVVAGDHAALLWPLLCGMAKAKLYLLTGDTISGEEAEQIGLVSMCVDDAEVDGMAIEIARRLAQGPAQAIGWTKYALNNWLRLAGPIFDTSLALEFMTFGGSEVREGLASHRQKREARFKQGEDR